MCSAITALQHHWDQLGLSMTMGRVEQRTPSSRQRSLSGHNTSLRDHWTDWSCGSLWIVQIDIYMAMRAAGWRSDV